MYVILYFKGCVYLLIGVKLPSTKRSGKIWCGFHRASSIICGNKIPTRCNRWIFIADLIVCSTCFDTTGSDHLYNTLELLMMGIMLPETCWVSNKICNKNSSVASSWHFISTEQEKVNIHITNADVINVLTCKEMLLWRKTTTGIGRRRRGRKIYKEYLLLSTFPIFLALSCINF